MSKREVHYERGYAFFDDEKRTRMTIQVHRMCNQGYTYRTEGWILKKTEIKRGVPSMKGGLASRLPSSFW